MAEGTPARNGKHGRHLVKRGVQRARALAQGDDGCRHLVDCNRGDRGNLGEAGPDIGHHDHDQRRQIEQQDQPGIAKAIGKAHPSHQISQRDADRDGEGKGQRDPRERHPDIEE
jgi:hypothetical protein